ncbi:16.6 kDa heat shock protein [Dichanthelium oligosanthes]|uniref:16.6 kDa heat shock protein n=1 Tax=Dichanthelium oligosanthes TaxID=888268 RepID=A0A1E5UTQ0_9POAL|nr:16.6 kDa heat shock protein [Dichanthelium oligosanthes]
MSLVRSGNVFDPLSLDFWASADPLGVVRPLAEQCPVLTNVRVDWKETPDAHVFRADLPGVGKEAAKVEVEDGDVLVISGERPAREEAGKDDVKWRLVERSSGGRFQRRFRLPRGARLDQVRASMEDGVLTVTVPKEEVKKPQVKAVEISG